MSNLNGVDADMYYQTDGVAGAAGWVLVSNIKDVTMPLSKAEADNTVRGNGGWRSTKGTLKDMEVSFDMRTDDADVDFLAFRDAWLNNNHIGIRIYDGADNGPEADFEVIDFEMGQEIEGVQMTSVRLKLTYIATAPVWNEA